MSAAHPPRSLIDRNVRNIASLNSNIGTKWLIKGTVTMKSEKSRWNDICDRFTFKIKDKSGEIEFTAFNKQCDKWFDFIEQNEVYYIARGRVTGKNRCDLLPSSLVERISPRAISEADPGYNDASIHELRHLEDCLNVDLVGSQREQVLYSVVDAEILEVNQNEPTYRSCPMKGCLEKVEPYEKSGWECNKCGIIYRHHKYTYKVTLKLKDETAELLAYISGDEAQRLLGENPFDLFVIGQNIGEMDEYERIMSAPTGKKFKFTLKTQFSILENVDLEHHVKDLELIKS